MSHESLTSELRAKVGHRAAERCEYCRVPDGATLWPHEVDHIIAKQHGGKTEFANLALACFHCNRRKGPNVSAVDPETGRIVELFNSRLHRWADHFRIDGPRIVPFSEVGRATVRLLWLGAADRVLVRQTLRVAGRWLD